MTGWDSKLKAEAKRRFKQGESARLIAEKLGVTRNQVIGVVNRAGLSRAGLPSRPLQRKKAKVMAAATRDPKQGRKSTAATVNEPLPPEPPKPALLVKLADLRGILGVPGSSCRFPFGSPGSDDFGFCGAETEGDQPYCGPHCAVAFQPLAKRERKARGLNFLGRIS